jgi:eukaryotic-like serine/threonine-protein kinase
MIPESAIDRLRALLRDPESDAGAGRYEILSTLGRGGMGTVYLARDTALDRDVALKVLEPDAEADPTIAARLAQEARILGRLEHPGIVPVHDFGRLADGRLFYAMKRIRGERLDRWMTGIDLHGRLAVFLRICDAVSFAHAHGVIHRDLKPENVMIGEFGEVLVLDWGIARVLDRPAADAAAATASVAADAAAEKTPPQTPEPPPAQAAAPGRLASTIDTAHGTIIGTPAYMAPEQARGEVASIDQRTDIYALGAMLQTLAGDSASGALRAIVGKARAERPAARYQTTQDLAADVTRFVSGHAVHARREPLLDRVRRVAARYRTPLLLILTYLLARLLLLWAFRV